METVCCNTKTLDYSGSLVAQQVAFLPHNTKVPGSIVTSGYYLCGFIHTGFHVSMWVSSKFSGFVQPKTCWWVDWWTLNCSWVSMCVHDAL